MENSTSLERAETACLLYFKARWLFAVFYTAHTTPCRKQIITIQPTSHPVCPPVAVKIFEKIGYSSIKFAHITTNPECLHFNSMY